MNCNDCQDEDYSEVEDDELEYSPPTWRNAEPANEAQAKAWMGYINEVFDQYPGRAINLPAVVYMAVGKIPGLRPENSNMVALQVERFIRESTVFELRKGKNGGVFRTEAKPIATIKLTKMLGVPDMITGVVADDYTCGCGNTKCNTAEKSCWKCGAEIKP
jgi:hypothetical protein